MVFIKHKSILSILSLILTGQLAYGSLPTAVEVLTSDDIRHSSTKLLDAFSGNYGEESTDIVDSTKNTIGAMIFSTGKIDVVFRATLSSPEEMKNNFRYSPAPLKDLGFQDENARGHQGFIETTKSIKDFVLNTIFPYQQESDQLKIIFHGQSRGAGIATLTAAALKDELSPKTSVFVLNYAPLPILNSQGQTECNARLGQNNILNFICQEDGILKLVNSNMDDKFKNPGTDILFSAREYPDFRSRVGNYTHLAAQGLLRPLAIFGLSVLGIDAAGWEGHMPETYLHSARAFEVYKSAHNS
jgi:hypothetical protein